MKCDTCGKDKKDNFQDTDPFDEEVNPDDKHPTFWWCKECYQEAKDRI